MMDKGNVNGNVERFSGFADIYDNNRPEPPATLIQILLNYLKRKPSLTVDLGCGTGLSTFIWRNDSERVIGIEPNEDMLNKAKEKLKNHQNIQNITFEYGLSNQININSNSVDIVTCSQSFHWMEPMSTLEEVSRILVDGGIFAAYDNDWPPAVDWVVENEYNILLEKVNKILDSLPEDHSKARKWGKSQHLKNIKESNRFRYVKEIVFHHLEKSDAERYIGLALSQGALQTVLKKGIAEIEPEIEKFKQIVRERFNDRELDLYFSYRMRMGIK